MRRAQRGFSLIETMVAAAIMLMIAMGAYELITVSRKSADDLEKRLRFRDLVDDIRFVFSDPSLCRSYFNPANLVPDAEVSIQLSRGTAVAQGAHLLDYGLNINKLYFTNVQTPPRRAKSLFKPSGELIGEFFEETTAADLMIEASVIGTNHPLRPMNVVRVLHYRLSGALSEEGCVGNHSFSLAGQASSGNAGEGRGHDGNGGNNLFSSLRNIMSPRLIGNRSEADCVLDPSDEIAALTGRKRIVPGEQFHYMDRQNQSMFAECRNGRIEQHRWKP